MNAKEMFEKLGWVWGITYKGVVKHWLKKNREIKLLESLVFYEDGTFYGETTDYEGHCLGFAMLNNDLYEAIQQQIKEIRRSRK